MTPFAGWQNFYVIVGSSAGALIGLQFVVMTLIAEMSIERDLQRAGSAFATPTIVHFAVVLLLSAAMCAPWHGIDTVAALWGLLGLGGVGYAVIVARRMQVQTAYPVQFQEWLFFALLPFLAYALLAASAYAARSHPREALFGVASVALLLLFIGIRNAWGSVTYHVVMKARQKQSDRIRE